MATGEGRDIERFAAAVENAVLYANTAWSHDRTWPNNAVPSNHANLSDDEMLRRELEVVSLLRESRSALAPSGEASARMRAKVMAAASAMMPAQAETAETPEGVSGSANTTNVLPLSGSRGRHRFPRRIAAAGDHQRGSVIGISAAAVVMALAVTGGGALFSQNALPGDTLYGVKKTTESGVVALTPGQENKGQRQLDYAATRLDEVQALNSNQAASADRGTDISQALRGFNEQTAAGSRLLLSGINAGNKNELTTLSNWANAQSRRLAAMRSSMPPSAQLDVDNSIRLLELLRTRAQSLSNRQTCDNVTSGESDELGPLPAKSACGTKESSTAPQTHSVSGPSIPAHSERSSVPTGTSRSPQTSSGGALTKPNTASSPELPQLPQLSGTRPGNTGEVSPLPGREQTRSNDKTEPSNVPAEQPSGLSLPVPLLPILLQPLSSGSGGKPGN
ncbi:MAG: hypothetical protein JO100_16425 [Pseudonocardia sp.]|nr:hypothetical protein [Pseudonocardia sp.]